MVRDLVLVVQGQGYGIECLVINRQRHFAFVNMTSIDAAIAVVCLRAGPLYL